MGTTACMARCVDLSSDRVNCGACGTTCMAGQLCTGGMCAPRCADTQTSCGGVCVDTQVDPAHCGGCGIQCGPGYACAAGICRTLAGADVAFCAPGSVVCGGSCVDIRNDNTHCGRCGNRCTADRACVQGMCVAPCITGQTRCGVTCTDPQFDARNCGMCGRPCAAGMFCVRGTCGTMPPLYRGWSSPIAGCVTTTYNAMAPTNQGGQYPYIMGDSNACRAWKLAATVCTTMPTPYIDNNNWQCPMSGGFTDPAFGTFCPVANQFACSTCPGACNAACLYTPLSLRNCMGRETAQP
jgi:hypothetical protein